MKELLWLLPVLPFAAALFLALAGGVIGRRGIAIAGCGSIGLSFLAWLGVASGYASDPTPFRQTLYTWIPGGEGFNASFGLHLDPLSLAMTGVVCFVGLLIFLYASAYMAEDEGYRRFFTYMNLFAGSMLTLLLADNLVLLYLGWEGVGVCSYLLIGFWYQKPENGSAARKAFFTTRIGDVGMALGVFLLFWEFRTLDFMAILEEAPRRWAAGDPLAMAAGLLLLAGACGKSAQIPLQVWLPDAMAGPTPVSALIHAATMVTAGVYLVARTHPIYLLAPQALLVVGVIGAVTALYAALAALGQREIKRILAYSTISQIGYMFLALGVGAFGAAIFHFMTHAFFKALLFLGAGVVIHAFHGENDVNKMGGLFRRLPWVGATFLAGSAALAALPLVTAGFYSKDAILHAAWIHPGGGRVLAILGLVTAFLTALYTFRAFFLIFLGPCPVKEVHRPKRLEMLALVVLAFFAITAGFVETPPALGGIDLWQRFMAPVFGGAHGAGVAAGHHAAAVRPEAWQAASLAGEASAGAVGEGQAVIPAAGRPAILPAQEHAAAGGGSHGGGTGIMLAGSLLTLLGIGLAWRLHRGGRLVAERFLPHGVSAFFLEGLGFDRLYERLFIRPFFALGRALVVEPIDRFLSFLVWVVSGFSTLLSLTQSGVLRAYAAGIVLGTIVIVWVLIALT